MAEAITLDGQSLDAAQVWRVAHGAGVILERVAEARVEMCARALGEFLSSGAAVYGVTTGFGANAHRVLGADEMSRLQRKLLIGHAVGAGPTLPRPVVRAMMAIRLNTLLRGCSGIRPATLRLLAEMLNRGVTPCVPALGSVGASGDLAPLSHMALPLLGLGYVEWQGRILPAGGALAAAGLAPIGDLGAKEGLALNNGTALMAALMCLTVVKAESLVAFADTNVAIALDALCGRSAAFAPEVHALRPHPGQLASAAAILRGIEGSELIDRPAHLVPRFCRDPSARHGIGIARDSDGRALAGRASNPQDAYSLRCAPQVHGAVIDQLAHARRVVEIEINSVTDNPLLIGDGHGFRVRSAGHFHGMPLALAMVGVKAALASLASISERRLAKLVDPHHNDGLPAFLVANVDGSDSGLMIVQYTAAALVNELATRAMPAAVHSIPTCANVEDHVSMGANEARQAHEMMPLVSEVLLQERYAAVQALRVRQLLVEQIEGRPPRPGVAGLEALTRWETLGLSLIEEDSDHTAALGRLRESYGAAD